MHIVNISDIKDDSILQKTNYINGIDFLDGDQCNFIVNAAENNIKTIESWFNILGIKYDNVYIINNNIRYTIGSSELSLSGLSSGERYLLYLLAGKKIEKQIVAGGLFERLGSKYAELVIEQFKDYNNLTIITYNALLSTDAKKYVRREL